MGVFTLIVILSFCGTSSSAADPTELADEQAQLAQKFERLETLAKRIAEMTEADDPARAEQLRRAIRKSQDLELPKRFQAVVELLEEQRLAAAARDQQALADQLQVLLGMLLEDPNAARIEAERKRLQEALKKLNQQIRRQQQLRTLSPEEGDAAGAKKLGQQQEQLADDVKKLEGNLRGEPDEGDADSSPADKPSANEAEQGGKPSPDKPSPPGQPSQPGKPGQPADSNPGENNPADSNPSESPPSESDESKSPAERASERLKAAEQKMREAIKQLEESNSQGASGKQSEAQLALEDAREEIERALRQLREEEQKRMLTQLATRLRRMLAEQADVLKLTQQTEEDRPHRGRRATALAAAGLANRERELVSIVDGALRLLREDGKSVAFPEVLSQIREDMLNVEERLRKSKLGNVTQRLEEEIIESLEEAVESVDKTIEDLEERQKNGQQGAQGGEPGEPPVVDKLAELRMIRMIQARILRRTNFWQEMRLSGEATADDAREALSELSRRELKLIRAVRNLEP